MTEQITSYKCNWCGKLHKSEINAGECAFEHAKINYANSLLDGGRSLETIRYLCGFHWNLTDEQKEITKDNCFVMSHWQYSDKPAYKIVQIDSKGKFKLLGKGGWDGYYGEWVRVEKLPKAHDPSEIFIYGE